MKIKECKTANKVVSPCIWDLKMVTCQGLLFFLFLETASASSCPDRCACSPSDQNPLKVDCSFRELVTLPHLPSSTQELYLQENNLETIESGAFDNLQMVQVINLSSNPWHCDCGILYLRNWLEDQAESMHTGGVNCFTPPSLHKRPISELKRNELPSCSTPQILCSDLLFFDAPIFLVVFIILLICGFLITRRTKFKVEVCDTHTNISRTLPSTSYQLKRRTRRVSSNPSLLVTIVP
ncbi:platelet glycoprotein IX [Anolis carolinensis]|uniref:platelet glycoprotein IX n=1 Tax=Anolis carolinensis TaxID=28377 RepID=UPI002F2B3D51